MIHLLLLLSQDRVDFQRDVQPVFEKSCYACHGAKSQMGALRLDTKSGAARAIQAGKPVAESTLFARIAGLGDQPRMPMGGKALDPAQIATIKRWIEQGADWPALESAASDAPKHWAFIPPKRPSLPSTTTSKWVSNPIDAFVLAKLEKEGLQPSTPADKITLLRRLSLDLIGLPPTEREVDAFLGDGSPNAYRKQVDRLLASPHYGERWGRHWLDAARYADSDGYEKDKQRFVWFYRDWVVSSINRDLGYDEFLKQQIAGDQYPNATQDQKVAVGFLRNSMINEEGGVHPEQFRMEAMFDRMDAISKGMLGLSVSCAQCHNHKFDPFSHEEYYRVFAFLNDSHEATMPVYSPDEQMRRADIFRKIRELEEDLRHKTADWKPRMSEWERSLPQQPSWTTLEFNVDDISTGGQRYLSLDDGSWLAQGYAPTKHKVKMTAQNKTLPKLAAFQLELLNDPNLPLNGPGRSILGTGAVSEFEAEIVKNDAKADDKPVKVKFARASADIDLPEAELRPMYADKSKNRRVTGPIEYAIDGKDDTSWGHDAGPVLRNLPRKAVFVPEQPIEVPEGHSLVVYVKQNGGGWNSDDNQNQNLGRFRISVTSLANAVADPLPANVRMALKIPPQVRSEGQINAIFSYWRTTVPEWTSVNDEIAGLWKQHPEGSSQLTLETRVQTRDTHILLRGDYLKPAKKVEPGVPAVLNPIPAGAPPTRLTFANWLTARNAPTTARVAVNRVWQAYFGTGIVSTSEDFGKQGEAPSHPELLDWLAVELMENKWSTKHLHRLIVNSSTYRQSSKVTPEILTKDPYNRFLSHAPRLRVEGEIVRDIALAASGLLNPEIGGPPVYPPAPEFLFQPPTSYGPKNWNYNNDKQKYRRALYTHRYRSVPYPVLQNFDAPNGDAACPKRTRSNTPLQALTTLNEPLFFEAAQALGAKTIAEGGSNHTDRIRYAFRRVLSRNPNLSETGALLEFLDKQQKRTQEPRDLWTAVARVILNLDEAITKE